MPSVNVAEGRRAEELAQQAKLRQAGKWHCNMEWHAGLRVVTVNVNSKGTLLRLLASWGSHEQLYDIILVRKNTMNAIGTNLVNSIGRQPSGAGAQPGLQQLASWKAPRLELRCYGVQASRCMPRSPRQA